MGNRNVRFGQLPDFRADGARDDTEKRDKSEPTMIKRLICLLCVAVTAAACNRPRNIPDEKLIAITREIFLANAYRDSPKSGFSQADTVDFYTPIFEKYGYYKEGQKAITMKGAEGAEKIAELMDKLRNETPKKFGSWDVLEARDYKKDECVDLKTGEKKSTGLPSSNVLYYALSDNAWCCARPSGTEPKIKFYMGVKGSNLADADVKLEELTKAVMEVAGQ